MAQDMARALFGVEVEASADRRAAFAALEACVRALSRLSRTDRPTMAAWLQIEALIGAAAAASADGRPVAPARLFSVQVLGEPDNEGEAAGAMERLARPTAFRRRLVDVPKVSMLADVALAAAQLSVGTSGQPALVIDAASSSAAIMRGGNGPTLGDVAQLTPWLLQRASLIAQPVGSLVAEPRRFVAHRPPLERLRRWASALESQAQAALARAEAFVAYEQMVETALARQRRPQAVRRAIENGLADGATWVARLARRSGIDIANAYRALAQAEALGLVVPLATRPTRGCAHVVAPLPVATALSLARASGPAAPRRPDNGLAVTYSDIDAATQALDALLSAKFSPSTNGKGRGEGSSGGDFPVGR